MKNAKLTVCKGGAVSCGGGREEEAKTGKLQHQVFKPTPGSG